jgi:hypothetical protein
LALILETGAGLSNSNSYASYAAALAYWSARGFVPTQTQPQVEQALIRGTDFLDQRFRFLGYRLLTTQALEWPRYGVYDRDGCLLLDPAVLPAELVKATIELAQRALAADLSPDPTVNVGGTVVGDRVKVAAIETEVTFDGASPSASFAPVYPEVNALLRYLICKSQGSVYRA